MGEVERMLRKDELTKIHQQNKEKTEKILRAIEEMIRKEE